MSVLDPGLQRLHDRVRSTGVPVVVGGAIAAMHYGESRATMDIDLVIQAGPGDAERIVAAFPADEFYVPPLGEVRRQLRARRDGLFNVVDYRSGMKADLYVAGDDPLIAYGFAHARERDVGGHSLRVAPATYVVAMKLRYFAMSHQDKHLRDIRAILALSPEEVDRAEVERWARQFGAEEAWAQCLARPGEEGPA